MEFTFQMSREEIFEMIHSFMPVRIALTDDNDDGDPERWVELLDPRDLSIEPSEGVFLDFSMRVHWPLPLLPDTFDIRNVSGSLRPEVLCVDGSTSLALSLHIAELDIKNVPDMLDDIIKSTIQKQLTAMRARLLWKIAETTHVTIELPSWIDPRKVAAIEVKDASIDLSTDGIRVHAPLDLTLHTGEGHDAQISFGDAEALDDQIDTGPL